MPPPIGFYDKKPKARTMLCWVCGKKLYAGGKSYREVMFNGDGREKIVHLACVDQVNNDYLDDENVEPPSGDDDFS